MASSPLVCRTETAPCPPPLARTHPRVWGLGGAQLVPSDREYSVGTRASRRYPCSRMNPRQQPSSRMTSSSLTATPVPSTRPPSVRIAPIIRVRQLGLINGRNAARPIAAATLMHGLVINHRGTASRLLGAHAMGTPPHLAIFPSAKVGEQAGRLTCIRPRRFELPLYWVPRE